jgi:hypothetical protein
MKVRRFGIKLSSHRVSGTSRLTWMKSTLSMANGDCVEVTGLSGGLPDDVILVRHSKDIHGPILRFTPAEWDAFLGGVLNGEFDRSSGPVRSR